MHALSKENMHGVAQCIASPSSFRSQVLLEPYPFSHAIIIIHHHTYTQGIRECVQYRGPPDPLRGDQIYKRVQEIAKETLDAVYDSEAPNVGGNSAVSHRIQGFGSEPYPVVTPGGGGGGGGDPATASGSLGAITVSEEGRDARMYISMYTTSMLIC